MRSASSRAGTLSRVPPSRMRSDGPPVLRMFVCPLPTCPSHLLTRSRASAGTIPAHAAAARSSRSAAWTEGLSGPPCRACYDMRRVPHKLARLAVLRSALPRDANALGMAVDDAADHVGQVGPGFDADQLASLNQRRN